MRRVFLIISLLVFSTQAVVAQTSENPFEGREITYTVGSKPGGGYDLYARAIAPYLEKHLVGATVVVRNDPAGGGVAALRRIGRDSDGLNEMLAMHTGLIYAQMVGEPEYDGDLTTFNYIGKASSEARFLLVRADAGLADLDALRERTTPLTCVLRRGSGSSYEQMRRVLEAFEIPARIVPGFRGSEREAALAKGEADCALSSEGNVRALLEAGIVEVVGYIGTPQDPTLSELLDLSSVAETPEQIAAVRFVKDFQGLGRITVAGPGASQAEVDAMRAAYVSALSDPEFLADAAQRNMPIDAADGSAVQDVVNSLIQGAAVSN